MILLRSDVIVRQMQAIERGLRAKVLTLRDDLKKARHRLQSLHDETVELRRHIRQMPNQRWH
jgi:hypothetical protein